MVGLSDVRNERRSSGAIPLGESEGLAITGEYLLVLVRHPKTSPPKSREK